MTAVIRTTVRLYEPEAEFVAELRRRTPEADAFAELTGEQARTLTAGTIVNALVEAGMDAVRQRAEQIRAERLIAHLAHDEEHQAWVASRATRRARRSMAA